MSHAKHFHSQNAPSSHALTELPDLSALAKSLHEVAQALLAISNAYRVATNAAPAQTLSHAPDLSTDHSHAMYAPDILDAMDKSGDAAAGQDAASQSPDEFPAELRCYRVPPYAVREERELLKESAVEDFAGVLNRVYDDLCATARLMQNFDEDKQVDGFTMQMIGEHLSRPLDTLNKTCSFFADFDLVRVTPTA